MNRARRALVGVVASLAAACATAPAPAPHHTRLALEGSSTGYRALGRATVAGEPVTLLVDTGATRSILPAAFVHSHELRRWPAATDVRMKDANGNVSMMS